LPLRASLGVERSKLGMIRLTNVVNATDLEKRAKLNRFPRCSRDKLPTLID